MIDEIRRQTVERIKEEARTRNDFRGEIHVSESYERPCFSGVTDFKNVNVNYNPNYPQHNLRGYEPERAFEDSVDVVIEHEIVHHFDARGRGCPKTRELNLEKVLAPISVVLKSRGFPNVPFGSQGHTLYSYFGNLFSDFVDNNIVCDNRGSEGLFLLYEDQLSVLGGKTEDLFEGFLKLQALTFNSKMGVSRVIPYFSQGEKPKTAVKNFLERTGIKKIPLKGRLDYLIREENWESMARIFAEEFSELLDKNNLEKSYFYILGGNDNSFLDDEDAQMEISMRAYGKKGSMFEPPAFLENNLALRSVYRALAKNLEMRIHSHSVETERPIVHVSRRDFDLERDSIERVVIEMDPQTGKLKMKSGKFPIKVKSRYSVSVSNIPEARIGIIDCSDSTRKSITGLAGKVMNPWAREDAQWTNTSVYHNELLCAFGLWELFRRRGTLKRTSIRYGALSNGVEFVNGLDESERKALHPSFNGTSLSDSDVERIFEGKGALVYTMSDGEILNWTSVREKFISKARQHHYFHLQIGTETTMSEDLKRAKLTVVEDDGINGAKLLIDLTQREIFGESK